MQHDETEETKPEGTRAVYTIDRRSGWVEPDGVILIRARATDDTTIWLGHSPRGDRYEVLVEGPDEPPGGRSYSGGPGSLAHNRFEAFRAGYERFFGALDAPSAPEDTDSRQDD